MSRPRRSCRSPRPCPAAAPPPHAPEDWLSSGAPDVQRTSEGARSTDNDCDSVSASSGKGGSPPGTLPRQSAGGASASAVFPGACLQGLKITATAAPTPRVGHRTWRSSRPGTPTRPRDRVPPGSLGSWDLGVQPQEIPWVGRGGLPGHLPVPRVDRGISPAHQSPSPERLPPQLRSRVAGKGSTSRRSAA